MFTSSCAMWGIICLSFFFYSGEFYSNGWFWTTSLLSVKIEFNPFAVSSSKLKPIASLLPTPWKNIVYDAFKIFNNSFLSFQYHTLLGQLRTLLIQT